MAPLPEPAPDSLEIPNPLIVVEVLSPSSEKTDRGRKWHEYQQIESLRHYLIVSQTVCEVQHHARTDDGWTVRVCGPGDVIVLGQPDAVREVYRLLAASKQAAKLPAPGTLDINPLGIDAVRPGLEIIIDYVYRQRLIPKRYTVDELFDDVTRVLGR